MKWMIMLFTLLVGNVLLDFLPTIHSTGIGPSFWFTVGMFVATLILLPWREI